MAIAGEQARPTPRYGQDAVAVELDLVAPVADRRSIHQRRQLRLQMVGQLGFLGVGYPCSGLAARLAGVAWALARRGSNVRSLRTLSGWASTML